MKRRSGWGNWERRDKGKEKGRERMMITESERLLKRERERGRNGERGQIVMIVFKENIS